MQKTEIKIRIITDKMNVIRDEDTNKNVTVTIEKNLHALLFQLVNDALTEDAIMQAVNDTDWFVDDAGKLHDYGRIKIEITGAGYATKK